MQNEFYQEISDTLASEYQYVIDNFNELKTLYNIDYYDGNVLAFLDKINNIADFKERTCLKIHITNTIQSK